VIEIGTDNQSAQPGDNPAGHKGLGIRGGRAVVGGVIHRDSFVGEIDDGGDRRPGWSGSLC